MEGECKMGLLGAFIGGVASFLSTAVSTVGSAIVGVASTLIAKLPDLALAKEVVGFIATVISKVAEFLGVGPKDENMEELGAKAMQEGIRPKMEEETTQEYLDYLRNEVVLDREKYEKLSDTEKVACSTLGTTLVSKSIEEKTGVELPPEFLLSIAKTKMRAEEITKFISEFGKNEIFNMGVLSDYLSNKLTESKVEKVDSIIVSSLKELNPDVSEQAIKEEILDMKRNNNKESY